MNNKIYRTKEKEIKWISLIMIGSRSHLLQVKRIPGQEIKDQNHAKIDNHNQFLPKMMMILMKTMMISILQSKPFNRICKQEVNLANKEEWKLSNHHLLKKTTLLKIEVPVLQIQSLKNLLYQSKLLLFLTCSQWHSNYILSSEYSSQDFSQRKCMSGLEKKLK